MIGKKLLVSYNTIAIGDENLKVTKQIYDFFALLTDNMYKSLFGSPSNVAFLKQMKQVIIKLCNFAASVICFETNDSDFIAPAMNSLDTISES